MARNLFIIEIIKGTCLEGGVMTKTSPCLKEVRGITGERIKFLFMIKEFRYSKAEGI